MFLEVVVVEEEVAVMVVVVDGEDREGEEEEVEGFEPETEAANSGSSSAKRKPVGRTLTAMLASNTEAGTPLAVGAEEEEEEEEEEGEEGEAEERAAPLLAAAASAAAAEGSVGCITEATVGAAAADGEDGTVADRASTSIGMQRVVYSPLSATSTTHTSSMCRSGAGSEGAARERPVEPLEGTAGAGELPGLLRDAAGRLPFAVVLVLV